jgi:hypothetical protein
MAADGQRVMAMLIADGSTVELQDALEGMAYYASLSSLGYRDHLYQQGRFSDVADIGPATDIHQPVSRGFRPARQPR